jgi:hypothetical protein
MEPVKSAFMRRKSAQEALRRRADGHISQAISLPSIKRARAGVLLDSATHWELDKTAKCAKLDSSIRFISIFVFTVPLRCEAEVVSVQSPFSWRVAGGRHK